MVLLLKTSYEVVVVGAGPAGIAAAYSAAMCGADTLLIEKSGCVGGMSTSGLLSAWCGSCSSGFYQKVRSLTTEKRVRRCVYSPETLKTLYLTLLNEAGVNLMLHTSFIKANVKNDIINSIDILGAGEVFTVKANVFIDATGDGFVARSAGVPYCKGRETDHLMQPMSLIFTVGGVDDSRAVYPTFKTHPDIQQKMQEYVEAGKIAHPAGHVILIEGYHSGTATVNMTNVIMSDGTDVADITSAELLTRRQVPQIIEFLRECVPGYEKCYCLQTAEYIGVRESLHFEGDYTLSENDILNQTIFDDWVVANAAFSFDNHNLTGSGVDKGNLKYNGERYTIPYRSLLAKGINNLLLSGRNISGTHMAHSSFRVMPISSGTGEGAGVAAALSAKNATDLRDVDIKRVQDILVGRFGGELPKPII